jgi:hypothetical protein
MPGYVFPMSGIRSTIVHVIFKHASASGNKQWVSFYNQSYCNTVIELVTSQISTGTNRAEARLAEGSDPAAISGRPCPGSQNSGRE